jgi:hypothetical protein
MQTFTLLDGRERLRRARSAVLGEVSPGLKWPNDLLFQGRKAGGMLTEARIDADRIRELVFGLGLNVNSPAADWPGELGGKPSACRGHGHCVQPQPPRGGARRSRAAAHGGPSATAATRTLSRTSGTATTCCAVNP